MKRILSIFAVVALLTSLFCVNVSAAVPTTTGGEWSVLISEGFETDTPTYFKTVRGSLNGVSYVAEAEGSENTVVDMKLGDTKTISVSSTDEETGETITTEKQVYYNNVRIGQGTEQKDNLTSTILLDGTYMIEFDLCAITPTVNFSVNVRSLGSKSSYSAVRINPNKLEVNKWYTFRIVVESTDTLDIDATTTTVYRKLRDSNEGFTMLENGHTMTGATDAKANTSDYAMRSFYPGNLITMGFSSKESYAFPHIDGMTMTKTIEGLAIDATSNTLDTSNNYPAALDTHYQLDNITVYAKAEESNYELSKGILTNWTMEPDTPVYTTGQVFEDGKWATYTFNTVEAEESGNSYIKYDASVAEYAPTRDYLAKFPLNVALPETFILSFDANNASLGAALDVVISGDAPKDETTGTYTKAASESKYPRNTLYFRSHEGIKDKWYSYKVVCSATPKQAGDFSFTVYRKERGSDEPYTKLDGAGWAGKAEDTATKDYGWASTMSGSIDWINTLQIGHNRRGLLSYYTKTYTSDTNAPVETEEKQNHENGVWYIDNVMITEANALTADFAVAENVLSADVNVSTAAATSAPVLAVYDGGRLVDVDFDALSHTGSAALSVDYDVETLTAPTAKFFVWETFDKAPLIEEVNIASYIVE